MPRRGKIEKREVLPDARYGSQLVTKVVHKVMRWGKKSKAEKILYTALDLASEQLKRSPVDALEQAIKNTTPLLQVKPRRVAGATYQVPVEVRGDRGSVLAIRWLLASARARSGKSMAEKLAAEIVDAVRGQGATIKKREETHRMAEANKAFAHFRW
ncbi:MAG: 30S ribosomal protein S7 [Dehalococcoidia bacterium]|nr:30S ribosomal protein S7 [Dehalococcoidia bacterium]